MNYSGCETELAAQARRRTWWLLAGLILASLVVWDLKFTVGVAAGGLLAGFNFLLLDRVIKRQFKPGGRPTVSGVLVRYYLRFIGTGIVIFLLFKFHLVGAIGLLIGLSVVVLNLTLTGLLMARRAQPKEA